jgi:hypothetical protein
LVDKFISESFNCLMKLALEKIKKNDFVLVFLFLIFGIAPIVLKLALTGLTGPKFEFYFFMVWIPVVTLALAMVRGWKEGSITGLLILGAFLIALISYPYEPLMDFRRQIVFQVDVFIVVAAVLSLGLQIVLRRRNKRSRKILN